MSLINKNIEALGLPHQDKNNFETVYSYEDKKYIVTLPVILSYIPSIHLKDGIYSFLKELKNQKVDELIIIINTLDFLTPKVEFGNGEHGIQLVAEIFNTDTNKLSFEEQYFNFVKKIYLNKQKFEKKIMELTELGYRNVHFYINKIYGSIVEITLYCETNTILNDEQVGAMLKELDDSYFKIEEKETKYILQNIIIK